MRFIRNTVLEQNRISKACLFDCSGTKNKTVKLALDMIVFFSYSIIESILKWEYIIIHFNTSDVSQLALPMIDVDVSGRIHKV